MLSSWTARLLHVGDVNELENRDAKNKTPTGKGRGRERKKLREVLLTFLQSNTTVVDVVLIMLTIMIHDRENERCLLCRTAGFLLTNSLNS